MIHIISIMWEEKASGWRLEPFLVIRTFLLIDNGGDRHSTGYERCLTACGGIPVSSLIIW